MMEAGWERSRAARGSGVGRTSTAGQPHREERADAA